MATSIAVQQEALTRAVSSQSLSNYAAIIRGFMAKGLPESDISPRENVFTFNAWKALGRCVRKGEHGVRCLTFIMQTNKRTGREEKRPWTTTVFHVSQTEPVGSEFDREGARKRVAEKRQYRINSLQIADHDATPENVPYAGEDEASRESGLDDAIAAHIQAPILSIEKFHADLEASGARFEHVKTDEVDYLLTTPEQPEQVDTWTAVKFSPDATVESFISHPDNYVAPKESAYNRAMRGETVSIMDIIDEQQREQKPAPKLPARADYQRVINSSRKSFQTKTVEF